MYKVLDRNFESFAEVEQYAWDTLKIELRPDLEISEADKQQACLDLEKLLLEEIALSV